ncbi:MAG: hypothetical protein K9N00_01235 [Candidatus Marinimicrobia bacterium]|nr:hypothetical protein [Candidatus Neomarinimicrobiota bacterium]
MWLPESMTHLLFASRETGLRKTIEYIGEKGEFHLTKVDDENLNQPRTADQINTLRQQKNEIEKIIDYFGIAERRIEGVAVKPDEVQHEARSFIDRFNRELRKREQKQKQLEKEEHELDIIAELLSLFPDTDFEMQYLFEGQYFNMVGGTIPVDEKESLQDVRDIDNFYIFHSSHIRGSIPVLIFYPGDEKERFQRITNRIRFSELERFNKFEGTITDCKEQVEINFWEINEQRTQIQSDIFDMGEDGRENLLSLKKRLETAIKELQWINQMGRTKNVYFINSYVPTRSARKIKKEIEDDENLYIIEEEKIGRNSQEADQTPVKLDNPGFISPFESLISTYGVPSYKGLDPTVPTMITFLVMFGIMFGDIGHGLVLLLCGIGMWLYRFLRKFSYFLIYMGLSSMVFGALFGEYFGMHPFQPLWFSPFENTENAMILGLYFGIFMVSTGFILRMVEDLVNKNYRELFLSAEGLPGFTFYISIIFIIYSTIQSSTSSVIYLESSLAVFSILVIALGRPILQSITTGLESETIMESIVEIIHVSIAVISNTLSFIRVAAFNIGHAILTFSIIKISTSLSGGTLGGKLSMLILGHMSIIMLEGLIVFIQTLRLEYYEFFSRFFVVGKSAYKPVKIK